MLRKVPDVVDYYGAWQIESIEDFSVRLPWKLRQTAGNIVRQLRIAAKGNSVYLDRENSREPFELLGVCSVVRTKLWSESPSDSLEE